ncbi:UNVERIFIED_CONTAM: hypothetical protein H355_004341 [Colinus virginianus]|nr:hypothetical protein H355_004341 [Colinus virginianus]
MRPYLCDKIIAERHFDYLRSKKILTREDTEEISSRSSSRKKTGKLLDYLAENPKGLDALVESIRRERTQNFLLQKITDIVLKVKNEKLESLKVCFVFQALERMRPYLCDKIIAERHFDYLRSKKILTREDTEEISSRSSSRKKTGKLLDYLAENPKGLDALVESIRRERTQNFLLQKITDIVLKVKNEKLESLKGEKFIMMYCCIEVLL